MTAIVERTTNVKFKTKRICYDNHDVSLSVRTKAGPSAICWQAKHGANPVRGA